MEMMTDRKTMRKSEDKKKIYESETEKMGREIKSGEAEQRGLGRGEGDTRKGKREQR